MYNHMISWELKAWIDQVVRVGKTIVYDATGPHGLLGGKKVVVITARAGSYPAGSPRAAMDFQEPYMRHVLKTLGFSEITFIHADNLKAADPQASISAAIQAIQKAVALRTKSEEQETVGAAQS
jgi:FMN-dependent NADH-azoreductase